MPITVNQRPPSHTDRRAVERSMPEPVGRRRPRARRSGSGSVAASRNRPSASVPPTCRAGSSSAAATAMPPVSDVGDQVGAAHGWRRRRRPRRLVDRADPARSSRRLLGQRAPRRRTRLARRDPSRLVPSSSSWASRSARLDAEMPTTATIAAMPMAMPSAVSTVRGRACASRADADAERRRRAQPADGSAAVGRGGRHAGTSDDDDVGRRAFRPGAGTARRSRGRG